MFLFVFYFFVCVCLCLLLFLLFSLLSGRFLLSRVKNSPFECGFDPKDSARLPFSVRFFLLAVVFLVFDIEIAFLFPLVYGFFLCSYLDVLIGGTVFLFILIFGILHEWREGALSWIL